MAKSAAGRGLTRGQVRTVVEILAPDVFEVEFSDDQESQLRHGTLPADQLLVLHYEPRLGGS